MPSHGGKLMALLEVTLLIALNLLLPKFGVGLWHRIMLAVLMPVPEAAIDEYDCLVFAHYDVGMTRQTGMVEAVTEAVTE